MIDYFTGRGRINVAVVFPNRFEVGMGSLGYQTLLRKLLEHGGCDIRRFTFDQEPKHGAHINCPDGGNLREADIILASISYELDYIRFAVMLIDAGIPVKHFARGGLPLIMAGGVAPSANPFPLSKIVDAVHIGECEGVLSSYIESFEKNVKDLRGPGFAEARGKLLDEWEKIGKAYIPGTVAEGEEWRPEWTLYENFPDDPAYFIDMVAPGDSVWSDSAFLIEVSRGCDTGCKFCLIGHNKKACRYVSNEVLNEIITTRSDISGVGLVGSSVGSYPHLLDTIKSCIELNLRVGLSSLNFRNTSDELFKLLAESGEHKVTLAVETGSAELQREIGKVLPDELVMDRVKAAFDAGMRSVKLYFVVGLPGEERPDVEESVALIRRIAGDVDLRARGGSAELDIGVSCFVPKAQTPWESKPMLDIAGLKSRISLMREGISDIPNLSFSAESPEMAQFQGILSVGDISTSEMIMSSAEAWDDWRAAFRKAARASGWLQRIMMERG